MSDLSPEGERRRDAILADVLRAARRRRARRQALRAGAIVAPAALVALVFIRPVAKPRAAETPTHVPTIATTPAARESSISVARIVDDPRALARHAITPAPPTSIVVARIGDDELLRELNAAGRRAGLASIAGRHLLLLDGEPITAAR